MSSTPAAVAVAASDPGPDTEPKQEKAAGPDVTMTEASEEEAPAAAAEVKDEEAVVLMVDDDAPEEPVTEAVADPLYATESAGMVVADEPMEGAQQGLEGGDQLEPAAGVLAGEAETKPGPAGDLAESSELGENHAGAAHAAAGSENGGELDNGVAHFEENGPSPSLQCARYPLPPLDKEGFRVSDLVWGKVKSHPWWPGEIFDPANASELALKHQRKGGRLVAYFGDNSFAWCDESQLKPFVANYSQMEKQSSQDSFVGSVNYALEELSRRILSGMSCSCLPEELSDNGMSYMVENAGLKDGVTCSAVNRSEILTCFSPENLLQYIRSLALLPGQGGDLLELVIACSQLTSLYRSKGCPELASFQTGSAWVEDGVDTSPTNNVVIEEVVVAEEPPPPPVEVKPKRGRGRPRKHRPEDNLGLTGKKGNSSVSNNNASYSTPQSVKDFNDLDANKKKRSLDSLEDSDAKSPTSAFGASFKIGECIRRAANQLTGTSSAVKSQNEPDNAAEAENAGFDVSSDDAVNELTVEKCAKRRRMLRHLIADPKELFSQLSSVAVEPMDKYNSSAMIISYFSDYRNYVVSATTEANVIEKTASKRGRKKRVLPSPELETTDHMQDSYWSGLSLHNHPIHSLKRAVINTRPRRKRKSVYDLSSVQHEEVAPKKQIQVIERSIIHVDEKIVDEWKPTALVLSFGRSTALPSETDLVKKFGRYGPLKESETEVQKNTNTVKIVFKKRADAERAFSDAGKYGTFGPSLRSYRLVNMPFSLGVSEPSKPEARPGDHGPEVSGKSEVSRDTVEVNQVDKTEKSEAVKAPSGEHVETVKKTCQSEPVKESSSEQVVQQACQPEADMAKKTGQIDAELTGPSDQITTAKHNGEAETVARESSEQVSAMEQPSLEKQSEIALSGAATGAVQVAGAIEPDKVTEADAENEVPEETSAPMELQAQSSAEKPVEQDAAEQTLEIQAPKEASALSGAATGAVQVAGAIEPDKVTEADAENEVPEVTSAPMELQAQSSAEKPVEQDAAEQTLEIQAPKEASVEIPRDLKLESKSLTEESVGQAATEQVKAPSDAVPPDSSDVQGSEPQPETVQFQAVGGTSIKQEDTTAEADTVQDVTEASVLEAGLSTQTVEPKTAEVAAEQVSCPEQTVQVEDIIDTSDGHADVGKQTAQEVTMAEAIVEGAVESKIEVPVGETVEDEATARTLEEAEEGTTTAEAPVDEMENTDATEALDERITEAENTIHDATVEAPDKKAATVEKTVDDGMFDAPEEKATIVEKTIEVVTVEAPHEKATAAERIVEGVAVEAPDEKATPVEKPIEDAAVEEPDEKVTAAEKTSEDAIGETPDEKGMTSKQTAEDALVEAADAQVGGVTEQTS
ncbi:PWWP domain-containing protein 3-like [Lolium rigidum]|uniref:PWWP domain-containing protein 3-like n=1 Tax=Lolium rigidum TaxID=89674 RepID=UPI001F5C1037|nr:PWWP domain-containing protein 3-like [Lolium rigidum]